MSTDRADRYIEELLVGDGTPARPRYRSMPGPLQELIPDLLYRCHLYDTIEGGIVTLTVFLRLGDLGGALWEQEMRIMERLAGLEHPSLPELCDGGYLRGADGTPGAAYIRTKTKGKPGDIADLQRMFQNHRGEALVKLWLLADALSLLTDARIAHRMLWPANLDVSLRDGVVQEVRLSRFEMGALVSNLFDSGHALSLNQVRGLYLQQPPESLVYNPPERLRFLFDHPDGQFGGPQGDVFSLGMMATEWLLGPACDEPVQPDYDTIVRRQDDTRRMLVRRGHELPSSLAEILTDMLDPNPAGRPTPYQVSQNVSAAYGDARWMIEDDLPEMPYLLAYMPTECDKTLLKWKIIDDSATTPEGREQLVDLIERDTRGAEILYSAKGAEGFADGAVEKLRRAKTVIVGNEITWFGEALWVNEDTTHEYDEILVIKFVQITDNIRTRLDALRVNALARRVPAAEAIAMPTEAAVAEMWRTGRPVWSSLVLAADSGRVLTEEESGYLEAMDWYLRYQRALLAARTYAYVLAPSKDGRSTVRWDEVTDRGRLLDDPLERKMVHDTRRLDMADFISSGGEHSGIEASTSARVSLATSPNGFGNTSSLGPFTVLGTIGSGAAELDTGRTTIPKQGWLRLDSDAGTMPQITRQAEARAELETQRTLLRQLIKPRTRPILDTRWDNAGGELEGEGRQAVQAILKHASMFALQGPPGTGKTEVTAQAVAEYVTAKPRARVLLSAQSHDALDNLAGRILDKLGMTESGGTPARLDRLALRIEPSRERRNVDERVAAFQPSRLADGLISYSSARATQWLTSRRGERPWLTPIVQDWLKTLPTGRLELSRRARTAANLVFATTGAATPQNLVEGGSDETFHWVLVEEAARAWPTELALPLIRGNRWTLIGDHAQIGAYSKNDIERFLLECKDHGDDEIKAMYENRLAYAQWFSPFAKLFDAAVSDAPRMTLIEERRMDNELTELVGQMFYHSTGGLKPSRDRSPHPLQGPEHLLDRRLIWIDTGTAERAAGFWSNDNEADLVARVVRSMEPRPGASGGPGLAVLTPYRKQVGVLTQRLSEHASRVFTIDGFQGREADIVVASLVRDGIGRDGTPLSSVGHVSSASRTNVLLSRARELLVIVGRWDVYAHHAGPTWRKVAEHFRVHGRVVRSDQVRPA
ncbi:AAA domain-containing protein [Dactylosporangium sp. AC04546]|uniref:AAA domain-containing protein n=1 Tax=Dactylosporangium sp. AC04546 TaxID=2862460 RepID=UPI002E7C0164|nr:AAA domain-containing protein [Dactylosporangium sp. AC04546]WVK83364.1 AAA domain-containing protein [Dactylosporangium sp. AC04546]